ncbi:MAG: hypothetical protein WA989_05375, partial [Henriciella sp.]|uniref:hypothetical protein n=1 Tax=Henriciella sp. TaxID=1968823 RepID=UPI003C759290
MVQIVFVHGVSVREKENDPTYENTVGKRRENFTKYCFKDVPHTYRDPYWGKHGATAKLGELYLKFSGDQVLGELAPFVMDTPETEIDAQGSQLLALARDDFVGFLNTLSIMLADTSTDPADPALADRIADYAVLLDRGEERVAAPAWVQDSALRSDEDFLEQLAVEVGEEASAESASLGLRSALKKVAGKIAGAGLNLVDGPIERGVRRVTPLVARFLGDVFVYLKQDGASREKIRGVIYADLVAAAKEARNNGEKLVVIGHSMGANILYDLFSDSTSVTELDAALGSTFKVDLFLTVGCQLGLFEELSLFQSSKEEAVPAPKPTRFERWWHVYNRSDVLSFAAKGIFKGVEQFSVDTKANIIDAHTAYFVSPVFQ